MLKPFACSRLGSWPPVSQDLFLLSVPQPHALSLSPDANEEIAVPCALTQGDQTHWSAFSRRQSLSLMFSLCKCLSPFFFTKIRCSRLFSSRNFRKSAMPLCLCVLIQCYPHSQPQCVLVPWSSPRAPAPHSRQVLNVRLNDDWSSYGGVEGSRRKRRNEPIKLEEKNT